MVVVLFLNFFIIHMPLTPFHCCLNVSRLLLVCGFVRFFSKSLNCELNGELLNNVREIVREKQLLAFLRNNHPWRRILFCLLFFIHIIILTLLTRYSYNGDCIRFFTGKKITKSLATTIDVHQNRQEVPFFAHLPLLYFSSLSAIVSCTSRDA